MNEKINAGEKQVFICASAVDDKSTTFAVGALPTFEKERENKSKFTICLSKLYKHLKRNCESIIPISLMFTWVKYGIWIFARFNSCNDVKKVKCTIKPESSRWLACFELLRLLTDFELVFNEYYCLLLHIWWNYIIECLAWVSRIIDYGSLPITNTIFIQHSHFDVYVESDVESLLLFLWRRAKTHELHAGWTN